jgi:flagellar basal-body rod protein FlgC
MFDILSGINSTSSALNAERVRMEVIAQNIANANVTRGLDGRPYQRQEVVFETLLQQKRGATSLGGSAPESVKVARIQKDQSPFQRIHNPTHPDADPTGWVQMPNVQIQIEMADMITASRTYEANLAMVKTARSMAQQALSIGKR